MNHGRLHKRIYTLIFDEIEIHYRFNFELDEVDEVGGNRYFRYNPSDDLVDKIGLLSEDAWEGL